MEFDLLLLLFSDKIHIEIFPIMATSTAEKGIMQLQRELNPEIVKALETVSEEKLAKLLGIKLKEEKAQRPSTTKWDSLSKRVKNNPISLGDYTDEDERVRREFREGFEFNHDR